MTVVVLLIARMYQFIMPYIKSRNAGGGQNKNMTQSVVGSVMDFSRLMFFVLAIPFILYFLYFLATMDIFNGYHTEIWSWSLEIGIPTAIYIILLYGILMQFAILYVNWQKTNRR
jgi:uncharacterized membrane protein AbrB (regulator of aidB expression)